jgi:superfamily II DNA or RNA helicase
MINIVLDNYIRVSGLPRPSFDQVVQRLTYPNPDFINAMKYAQGKVNWIPRTIKSYAYENNELLLPKGYYMEFLTNIVANSHVPFQIIDKRHKATLKTIKSGAPIRPYQEKMIQEALLYPGPSFIMQAAPGTGKTFTGLELARRESRKVLWITHTKELANQTIHAASDQANVQVLGIPKSKIGIIGQGKFIVGDFLTVATVQTLYRRYNDTKGLKYEFGTVIVDEVHHAPAKSWQVAPHLFAANLTFGLTANAYRTDGLTQLMYDCMGPVVTLADKAELIKEGILVMPSVLMVNTGVDVRGATYGSIVSNLTESDYRNNQIMDVIKYIRKDNNPNNVLIVLSSRRQHVEELTRRCVEEGLEPLMMLGDMSALNRTLAAEKIRAKTVKLIIATDKLLGEGFDYPPINFVVIVTPFKDSIKAEQITGRAQRVYPGKEFAYILDFVDNNRMVLKQAQERMLVYRGLGMEVKNINANTFVR